VLLFAVMFAVGITWGLPSRNIDKYLFGDGEVWSGEKIYRLAKADQKFSPTRGADVDADPITGNRQPPPSPQPSPLKGEGVGGNGSVHDQEPIPLTATEADVAKIYLRYRLYTYQPDEMITMMALAGMRPSKLDFDPRLYQYGGLFIYPVGALIKLCGLLGLIDVRNDVVFYLDNPDEFGKFYIVARAYSAAWGLLGVIVVYAIAKRLASHRAALLAALLFTLMPVVVCMAHEGKPHLPGAVLMLLAVYFAIRCSPSGNAKIKDQRSKFEEEKNDLPNGIRNSTFELRQFFWWMCVCCGAALGMALSSWPVFVLIPLVAFRAVDLSPRDRAFRILTGTAAALAVYLVTNPYILINVFTNRDVLKSNFGNSLAMYEVARVGEGFIRVMELTVEGATLPVLLVGLTGLRLLVVRKNTTAIPLIVVATVFFLQFVLIGAGKPAEYGRFGIFTNMALAIGTASLFAACGPRFPRLVRWFTTSIIVFWVGYCGAQYARNFYMDTTPYNSRLKLAKFVFQSRIPLSRPDPRQAPAMPPIRRAVVVAEPAPYDCPPLPFAKLDVVLVADPKAARAWHREHSPGALLVRTVDRSKTPYLRPSAHESYFEFVVQFLVNPNSPYDLPETPISWADKPFFGHGLRVWND